MKEEEKRRKIEAHSSHLLTLFLQLRERYAILRPMLHDETVVKEYGSWKQAPGFKILKTSLFLSCCQDIAKLSMDRFDTTPSVCRLMTLLASEPLRSSFRQRYRDNGRSNIDQELDLAFRQVEEEYEEHYANQRLSEFDSKYIEAVSRWAVFSESRELKAFLNIRNKVTAHTQIHFDGSEYRSFDVGNAGITWGDLRQVMNELQALVELLSNLIRDSGFAWESLDKILAKSAGDFWCERLGKH